MENGLLLAPAGPKVIRFVPPLIVSAEEIDQGSDILEKNCVSINLNLISKVATEFLSQGWVLKC